MNWNAVTLTELRSVVADTGNLGRAAARCHVSQPTLSTQVKKLGEPFRVLAPARHDLPARAWVCEQDLRGERVLVLTEGHCLREYARPICGDDIRARVPRAARVVAADRAGRRP